MSDTKRAVELYDTTLRDGAQRADLSYSIDDRLRILHKLDQVGFPFVEGGWPGANPRDTEFFSLASKETLKHAQLTAFGMTRKAGGATRRRRGRCATCSTPGPRSSAWWARRGISTSPRRSGPIWTRASRWSATPSAFLRAQGRRVFFDAEHFFDGYLTDPGVRDARCWPPPRRPEPSALVLCDTNGGMLPFDVARIVEPRSASRRTCRSGSTSTTTRDARSRTR